MKRLTWPQILLVVCVLVVVLVVRHINEQPPADGPPAPDRPGKTTRPIPHDPSVVANRGDFLFCFWNVENLFDDRDDGRKGPGDREYDPLYASRPDLLKLKLDKLTEALLKLNDGRGPDILAVAEVEGVRAAELLKDHLNAALPDPAWQYPHLIMKEISGGRHIAPAIITRLPVRADRTRPLGSRQRIVQGAVEVNGHELNVIASHWTSRLNEGDTGRANYADTIYGACNAMYRSNPAVDFLVCGDFNDTPQDEAVTAHLHGTANVSAVRRGSPLQLLNLMADKDPETFGTHYYRQWFIFDQILVSPGMLDRAGWSCDLDSVQVVNTLTKPHDKLHRPWRFGSENEKGPRGYSDHFPVTVRLKVAAAADADGDR